jgi:hypothetical protein
LSAWATHKQGDEVATLAQILEDAEGRRSAAATLFVLDLRREAVDELAAHDQYLSLLIVNTRRRLGLPPGRCADGGPRAARST